METEKLLREEKVIIFTIDGERRHKNLLEFAAALCCSYSAR